MKNRDPKSGFMSDALPGASVHRATCREEL